MSKLGPSRTSHGLSPGVWIPVLATDTSVWKDVAHFVIDSQSKDTDCLLQSGEAELPRVLS